MTENYSNVDHNDIDFTAVKVKSTQSTFASSVTSMYLKAYKPSGIIDKYVDSLLPETELVDKRDIVTSGIALPMALIYHAALLALFLGFFLYGYHQDTTTVYLAPYVSPQPSSCKQIPISTTQTFKVDNGGNWQGSLRYKEANAVYAMELIRANLNEEMYRNMIQGFMEDVTKTSDLSSSRDLQFYQLVISSFNSRWRPSTEERESGAEGVVNFFAVGDAQYVFNSDVEGFSFFNEVNASVCVPDAVSVSYDLAEGYYIMAIDVIEEAKNFSSNYYYDDDDNAMISPCPGIFELSDLAFEDGDTEQLKFKLNVPALTTAAAINYDIASITSLTQLFNLNTRQSLWASNQRRLSESEVGSKKVMLNEIYKFKEEWKNCKNGVVNLFTLNHSLTRSLTHSLTYLLTR